MASLDTRVTPRGGRARARSPWRPRHVLVALLVTAQALATACRGEEAVPRALRERLANEARLSDQELDAVRQAVGARIGGRTVRVKDGADVRTLDEHQRALLFEVLSLPAGVFDEGVRREAGRTFRVLNGPARSDNTEIEAYQRLWVDADTLLPRKYEFAYAFPGYGEDRSYEITFAP